MCTDSNKKKKLTQKTGEFKPAQKLAKDDEIGMITLQDTQKING